MKLNELKADGFKSKKWCGPTALALITGQTLRYCHNTLADIRGIKPRYLRGISHVHMRRALDKMGYSWTPIEVPLIQGKHTKHRPTLKHYILQMQRTADYRSLVLINVTGHYVVARRGMIADNADDGEPCPVDEHWCARKRVQNAWLIVKAKKRFRMKAS